MDRYFVPVKIVVNELEGKTHLEHPGAVEFLNANGGARAGLPFLYFSSANGKLIANSIRPRVGEDKGGNIGCPYEPEEIAWFLQMLKKAAPSISKTEMATVRVAFESLKRGR